MSKVLMILQVRLHKSFPWFSDTIEKHKIRAVYRGRVEHHSLNALASTETPILKRLGLKQLAARWPFSIALKELLKNSNPLQSFSHFF